MKIGLCKGKEIGIVCDTHTHKEVGQISGVHSAVRG
jgi:hypothetical protein